MERLKHLKEELSKLRDSISTDICDLIINEGYPTIKINKDYLDVDVPIILTSFNDSQDEMTLDKISVIDNKTFDVSCSNSYLEHDTFSSKILPTEVLIDIYEFLINNMYILTIIK